jgi:hypothetical protein
MENFDSKRRLKALLKEEEPLKHVGVIDRMEGSRNKIDEYVARITGVEVRVIATTRRWHRIIETVILEEGKELLDTALEELEIELRNLKKEGRRKEKEREKEKRINAEMELVEVKNKIGTKNEVVDLSIESSLIRENCEAEEESLISKEVKEIERKLLAQSKTAVEILLDFDLRPSQLPLDVKNNNISTSSPVQIQKPFKEEIKKEIEDLSLHTREVTFTDVAEPSLEFLQEETLDKEKSKEKQIELTRDSLNELKGDSLEASAWAPNENTCKDIGEYRAKVAAALLPGDTSEERTKFVKGTLHRNSHITKIEECFTLGNPWVIISFDCHKGVEILKEKLKEKEIEWYKVIFEEDQLKAKGPKEKRIKESKVNSKTEDLLAYSNKKSLAGEQQPYPQKTEEDQKVNSPRETKEKNRDFTWITLWDLPLEYSKQEIQRILKHLGSVEEIKIQKRKYSQVAEAKIYTKNEEQLRKIKANWVVGLENGKLARLTVGSLNTEDLKEREGFRATLMNIPSTAHEALLLRALRVTEAKAVYIPYNSNRNPSRVAKVFFKTKEDRERALNRSIFYFNTRLFWKEEPTHYRKEGKEIELGGYKKENIANKEKRAVSPKRAFEEKVPSELPKINLQQTAGSSKSSQQQSIENNLATVINKLCNRLEALESKWESAQRPWESRAPNRS